MEVRLKIKIMTIIAVTMILFVSCASTGRSDNSTLSLHEAIEVAAERITADLTPGSRVAVISFESPSGSVSAHILEEIAGALFDRRIEVADRQNLEHVLSELDFQMSGYVSDESALSIGQFLGAELVITGQLRYLGDVYRFQVNAVNVEDATRGSVIRLDVRNDRTMQNMMLIGK
jgi:hypothetical protein